MARTYNREIPEPSTMTVARQLGTNPAAIDRLVKAGRFTLPTTREGCWCVWQAEDIERLRECLKRTRGKDERR